jgi:hypothetical protein
VCEHPFVPGKGHPHAHLQRAIERRHLLSAEAAARQLERVALADALALTLLILEQEPRRFSRAAARWHARFVLDTPRVGLGDSQLALAAVAALPDGKAAAALAELARRYRVANVDSALRHLR